MPKVDEFEEKRLRKARLPEGMAWIHGMESEEALRQMESEEALRQGEHHLSLALAVESRNWIETEFCG